WIVSFGECEGNFSVAQNVTACHGYATSIDHLICIRTRFDDFSGDGRNRKVSRFIEPYAIHAGIYTLNTRWVSARCHDESVLQVAARRIHFKVNAAVQAAVQYT